MSGAEDLILVLLQNLNPRSNVGGVVLGVVWYTLFCCDENAGELGTKFLLRVVGVAKSVVVVQGVAIQTAWVTGPVPQLVKGGSVVAGRVFERFLRRKMNGVS